MKILFYSIKGAGHVNPTLPVVRALVAAGHEVAYSLTLEWQATIEETGARFFNVGGSGPFTTADYHPSSTFPLRIVPATAAIAPRLLEEARNWQPDLIVHDSMAMWGRLVARALSCPSVASVTTLVLPDFTDLGVSEKMLDEDPVNVEAAKAMDARFGEHPSWSDPSWTLGDDALVYSCAELNPGTESVAARLHFVGSPHDEVDADSELTAHGLSHLGRDRNVVYVALGTLAVRLLGLDATFFRPFVEVAASRDDVDLVISVGSTIDPASLGPLPGNVTVRQSVPQVALLSRTRVFFSHVGSNSMHEALLHGVPLVCVPCFAEQPFNARRVEEVGAGVVLPRERLDAASVEAAMDRVANDPAYRRTAQHLSARLRVAGGVCRAVDVLARVARRSAR